LLKDLKAASEVEISSRLDHLVKRAISVQVSNYIQNNSIDICKKNKSILFIKVHALIIDGLYKKYHGKRSWGGWLSSSNKIQLQKSLIDDLGNIYLEIHNNNKYAIPLGNFPHLIDMKVIVLIGCVLLSCNCLRVG